MVRKDGTFARKRVVFRKTGSGDGCRLVGEPPEVGVAGRDLDDLAGVFQRLQSRHVVLASEPHRLQSPREGAVMAAFATAGLQDLFDHALSPSLHSL